MVFLCLQMHARCVGGHISVCVCVCACARVCLSQASFEWKYECSWNSAWGSCYFSDIVYTVHRIQLYKQTNKMHFLYVFILQFLYNSTCFERPFRLTVGTSSNRKTEQLGTFAWFVQSCKYGKYMNSWWWTKWSFETCRVVQRLQNKYIQKVHLVGLFI